MSIDSAELKDQIARTICDHVFNDGSDHRSEAQRSLSYGAATAALILLAQKIDLSREAREEIARIGMAGTLWTIEELLPKGKAE